MKIWAVWLFGGLAVFFGWMYVSGRQFYGVGDPVALVGAILGGLVAFIVLLRRSR